MSALPVPAPFLTLVSKRATIEAALLDPKHEHRSSAAPALSEAAGGWTILVVDDDADIRKYVAHGLTTASLPRAVRVLGTPDGHTALRYLKDQPVDVLILDVHMDAMGGLQLAAALDAEGLSALPILFISGDAESARPLLSATRHFLAKPFNSRRLVSAVLALLGPTPSTP